MTEIKYIYKPEVEEIFIFRKGRHKGKIVTAWFSYGHTVMFDLSGNFVFDYCSGYFDGDNYLTKIATRVRPAWELLKKRFVSCGKVYKRN